MKATKLIVLPLAYCVCLVLLANEAQAKAATDQVKGQVQDMTHWTKEQFEAYLDKYSIAYNKADYDDNSRLLETVQKYRDAAVANAGIFINDKTHTIERILEGLKIKLEKHYKLGSNTVNAFTKDIEHELKQLELSGALTQDKVKQSLDKLQHKAVKQKYVTAAQYREIANDLESAFATPSWFQKVFGGITHPHDGFFAEDGFHTWISSSVTQRLQENKALTKDEIQTVVEALKHAIASTYVSVQDLGTADWWENFSQELEKNTKFKQDQVAQVIDSLKDEVNAYKIFAMDYAGEAADQSQHVFSAAAKYLKDTGNSIYEAVIHPLQTHEGRAASAASSATDAAASSASSLAAAAASATDAAASSASSLAAAASDAAASSASVLRSQATHSVNQAKNSFGHFWRQKELETWRKIGYTEAHIDWMENYLSKTLYDKKNLAKDTVQHAVRTIRQYLVQAKVQTAAHIDAQLKSLEGLVESWRRTTVRDEL